MYLRFALPRENALAPSREGVFMACHALLERGRLTSSEEDQVRWYLDWFNRYLPVAECLDDIQHRRAICWFLSSAHTHLKAMWDLVELLRECGVPIELLKTRSPGTIVYEDEWQIAAVPSRRDRPWRRW